MRDSLSLLDETEGDDAPLPPGGPGDLELPALERVHGETVEAATYGQETGSFLASLLCFWLLMFSFSS